ncbi:putative endo beta 1,3-glucanase, GH81 family [Peziza echinospora]|nr:putative endo beta 1,3-glucanase, GH81 family [Peziza echinospora]
MRPSLIKFLFVLALSAVGAEAGVVHGRDTPATTTAAAPKAEISVTTVTSKSETIQMPAKSTSPPKVLGFFPSELERSGRNTEEPFPDGPQTAAVPTTTIAAKDKVVYTKPATISAALTTSVPTKAKRGTKDKRQFGAATVADIFIPIATTEPSAIFPRRTTHQVSRKNVQELDMAAHTNKFYANIFLGTQDRPVVTMPYSVWWSKGDVNGQTGLVNPWGLSVAHVDENQRQYGPTNSVGSAGTGAIEYYYSPIWVRSMHLGATEFSTSTSSIEFAKLRQFYIRVDLFSNKGADSTKKIRSHLCLGQGFVSSEYFGLTPRIESDQLFSSVTRVTTGLRAGLIKYKVTLGDGKRWVIYAEAAAANTAPFTLTLVNNRRLQASGAFFGVIQVAKVGSAASTTIEALLDASAGGMCIKSEATGQVSGSTGSYQINYTRQGGVGPLLMFALPHHVTSFEAATTAAVKTSYTLTSLSKGTMTAVVADQWRLREADMPTNIGWLPVKTGTAAVFPAAALTQLAAVAAQEIAEDFNGQSHLDSMYFSGKALSKFAYVCLTTYHVLNNPALAATCLTKLRNAFAIFPLNQQQYKLAYETKWRGIISEATYITGDNLADFGNGLYNDHHFHYAYFIHAAAVIAYLDTKSLTSSQGTTWLTANKDWVDTLVRDVANPSASDTWFPIYRSFDWWHGHSWAKGLFESLDGKDQESSSEDANFAYSMKMWGHISNQPAMEARGNLMLGVLRRSINTYMLLHPQTSPHPLNPNPNSIHPASFNKNFVVGILFENKAHHTTYFGVQPQHIQGIHMLPLTPVSNYIRTPTFVQGEWNAFFSNGRAEAVTDGWKGILFSNLGLWKPRDSWLFFAATTFQQNWLDGGASRTWALAFAGMLGGASP